MRGGALACLVGFLLLGLRPWGQEPGGNRAYRNGDYERAVERYREAMARGDANPRLRYNLGTALLRAGRADEAVGELEGALDAQSAELRGRAFYNLGNARLAGSELPAEEDLGAALDAYRRALLLDPANDDARWNYELALRRLDELDRSQSLPGDEPRRRRPGESDEREQGGPEDVGGDSAAEPHGAPGGAPRTERYLAGDAPLPRELAEQILRAVEERERGLQREKLRRQRRRSSGPDW